MTAAMDRRRTVRWSFRAACGHWVTTGQKTISHDGGKTWICRPCALLAVRATTTTTTRGQRP